MGALLVALTFLGYFSSSVFYVAVLYNDRWQKWGLVATVLGFMAQTGWLAQKANQLGTWPDGTLYDWTATYVWVAVLVFGFLQFVRPTLPVGGFLMPIATLIWLGSQALSRHLIIPSYVNGLLFAIHVVAGILAYVAFLFAAVFSIMYTEKERELRRKQVRLFYYQLPSLDVMDVVSARLIYLGA